MPLLLVGELSVSATNRFLQVSPFIMALSAITLFFLTFGIGASGMAVGVVYPNFTAEHSAKIAASFGGVVYLYAAEHRLHRHCRRARSLWPVYLVFMSQLQQVPPICVDVKQPFLFPRLCPCPDDRRLLGFHRLEHCSAGRDGSGAVASIGMAWSIC